MVRLGWACAPQHAIRALTEQAHIAQTGATPKRSPRQPSRARPKLAQLPRHNAGAPQHAIRAHTEQAHIAQTGATPKPTVEQEAACPNQNPAAAPPRSS